MPRYRSLSETQIVMGIISIIATVMFLVLVGEDVGFDSSLASDFVMFMPSLFMMFIGVALLSVYRGSYVMGGFIMLGIGVSHLTGTLNDLSILVPDLLTTNFTITNLQLVIIIFAALIGAAFSTRR